MIIEGGENIMIPFPNKKYNVITIDPPYPIKKILRKVRPNQKKNLDYPTMSLEEIKALPIHSISEENSVCFLWTIQKYLKEAFDILECYGFKYQRIITWDKKNGMCLFGFHHRTEFTLFGYKGKLEIYPHKKAMPTIIIEYCNVHSRKPNIFYKWAETFGDKRIDIFAREKREDWDVWGDEV